MFSFTTTRSRRSCFRLYSALAAVSFLTCVRQAHAQFKILDDPLGTIYTQPNGISGSLVVGDFFNGTSRGAFVYDGSNYYTIAAPGGYSWYGLNGISGTTSIGFYQDNNNVEHGFINSGGVNTTLDIPSALYGGWGTVLTGISGSHAVGYFIDGAGVANAAFYNGSYFEAVTYPGASGTYALSVDGNNVVGFEYTGAHGEGYGYLYNGSSYSLIADPLSDSSTFARGISGGIVVGDYYSLTGQHGFLYNIYDGQYTTYDVPVVGARQTQINGIDGTEIIGTYYDSSNQMHGFEDTLGYSPAVATPEPGTVATLFGLGVTVIAASRKRRSKQLSA